MPINVVSESPSTEPSGPPSAPPTRAPNLVPFMVVPFSVQPSSTPRNNSINNGNDNNTAPPFRDSATDAANTILVNTKLILPPPSDGIQESILVFPINGVLQVNPTDGGSITYTPNNNFVGSDAFTILQCRSNNATISDDAECQSLMVMVKVTEASSSNGTYGLFALLLLPLLLAAAYWVHRRQKGEDDTGNDGQNGKNNEVTAPVASDMISPNNSNSETILIPSGLVAEIPSQPTSLDKNTGSDYQVSQKDQCRSVVGEPIRIVDAVAIPNAYKPLDVDAVPAVTVDTTSIARDTVSGSSIWEA
jgi:hypothetical protein